MASHGKKGSLKKSARKLIPDKKRDHLPKKDIKTSIEHIFFVPKGGAGRQYIHDLCLHLAVSQECVSVWRMGKKGVNVNRISGRISGQSTVGPWSVERSMAARHGTAAKGLAISISEPKWHTISLRSQGPRMMFFSLHSLYKLHSSCVKNSFLF